jgi:dTDP-4-amino-4,6-dideoxygalactose transaminase
MERIWLSPPHLGVREKEYLAAAVESNWVAPLGPCVDGFEADLQAWTGARAAAALSSGTAAIHLGLALLGVQPGDYVLCQSLTFAATANPIRYLGAVPVFVDSERESWNLCPQALERAIDGCLAGRRDDRGRPLEARRPAALLPVHIYGMPANMAAIGELAQRHRIPILEDAAEALGSTWQGKACGTLGTAGALSFNGNKIITTSGGGALLADDPALIERARFLASQAREPAAHYEHACIGYNYRLSNLLAAVGRAQLEVLADRVRARRANFDRYAEFFAAWRRRGLRIDLQPEPPGAHGNRWLTCGLVDPERNGGLSRDDLRLALAAEHIEARPLWKPLHLQPVFAGFPFFGDGTSEALFASGLCLPSGSRLTDADFERILGCLERAAGR